MAEIQDNNTFCNIETRMFYISEDVSNASMGLLCFNLLHLIAEDDEEEARQKSYERPPIHIYINSMGGNLYDMWGLVDIMLTSKTPIYTYCTGYAMSAAFLIFLAGHKRFCWEHSTFMYHQLSCVKQGTYQDLLEEKDELDYMNKDIEDFVLARTEMTEKDISKVRKNKKDYYIHVLEALEKGIVHDVIGLEVTWIEDESEEDDE